MFAFLAGIIVGAALVLLVIFIIVVDPWGPVSEPPPFIDQFRPIQIPEQLLQFLKSGDDGQGISKWESCHSLSLFLHMFFQEHKDTRQLRRWMHKRLQLELNDIATRSAAGRLLQEVRIRDLSLGTKFPTVNAIRVENVEMSEDRTLFEKITFVVDMDYTGGFETSVDVTTMFGKKANLSVKITKLAGMVRLILSRKPYNHWTMSFVSAPVFETDISSQIQGHQLRRLIPLIKESIKRALQRKHVWPNYKIRYRPVFPNPLFQTSPPLNAFAHVKLEGGLEITVLQCSRLKTELVPKDGHEWDVYCTVNMDKRPFLQNTARNVAHSLNMMLIFSRYDLASPVGLTFAKQSPGVSGSARAVRVATVEERSLANKALFKPGDVLVAINNVPIRSERQAMRFLQQTTGDLMVVVERNLDDLDDQDLTNSEKNIGDASGNPDNAFVDLGGIEPATPGRPLTQPASTDFEERRRHSVSEGASLLTTGTDSVHSSLNSLDSRFDRPDVTASSTVPSVQRTESARVPQLLVSQSSVDLRRSRSESQLDSKTCSDALDIAFMADSGSDEYMQLVSSLPLGRMSQLQSDLPDRDATLVPGSSLKYAASSASLLSSISAQTDGTNGTDDAEDEEYNLNRNRAQSTRKQRIQATFQAGKKKVLDFIPAKKKMGLNGSGIQADSLSNEPIEIGAEAGELDLSGAGCSTDGSPLPNGNGKHSPVETEVIDKVEKPSKKEKKSKKKQPGTSKDNPDSPVSSSNFQAKSRSTKSVHLSENVIWGQSLHFELTGDDTTASPEPSGSGSRNKTTNCCKYLNVTIHARQVPKSPTSSANGVVKNEEPKRPILLGYTSLYIAQLVDDCLLTLSNCHREVFPLKPPPPIGVESAAEVQNLFTSEFARHAGFDSRLCYGDVTLGFRYFPDGLPFDAAVNAGDSEMDTSAENIEATNTQRPLSPPAVNPSSSHDWSAWTTKSAAIATCAMCRGKIWLKSASCCQLCLVVCHTKCTQKANNGIACSPNLVCDNDARFEDLDVDDLNSGMLAEPECSATEQDSPLSIIPCTPKTTASVYETSESVSRRTKLKNKVSEKFSAWRRRGTTSTKEDSAETQSIVSGTSGSTVDSLQTVPDEDSPNGSPVASIQDCLSDVLPRLSGSPFIANLYFTPGNAYNEDTINNAKQLGKEIFANLTGYSRKEKINEQIDIIQLAIRETKDGRLEAMKETSDSANFKGLDERLQALAVLMLHYCAALQDCLSTGRCSPTDSLKDERIGTPIELADDQEIIAAAIIEQGPCRSTTPSNTPSPAFVTEAETTIVPSLPPVSSVTDT